MSVIGSESIETPLVLDQDHGLVEATKSGDLKAFASLYDRHAPAIYGMWLDCCENKADADRLLEETFLRLWQHRKSLRCPPQGMLPCLRLFVRSFAAANSARDNVSDVDVR